MSQSTPPPKRSPARIILRLLSIFVGGAILFVAFLPAFLSYSIGKERLVILVNSFIPGKVEISNLSVAWFGPQVIQGVTLKDPEGNLVLSLDSAEAQSSLFALLLHPSTAGELEFHAFNASVTSDSSGNTNLMRALDKKCCAPRTTDPTAPVTAVLKNVNGVLNLAANSSPLTLKVSGETQLNSLDGKFNIDAQLLGVTPEQLLRANKDVADLLRSTPEADLKISADVSNFPIGFLDQIIALKKPELAGLLTEAFGPQLNIKMTQQSSSGGITVAFDANSPNLSLKADVAVTKDIRLSKPAVITLNISPSFVEKLSQMSMQGKGWRLTSPTTLEVTLTKLELPLSVLTKGFDALDFNAIGLTAAVEVAKANLVNDERKISVSVNGAHANIVAEVNAPTAAVMLTAEAVSNQQPTKINISLTLPKALLWQDISTMSLKDIVMDGQVSTAPLFLIDEVLQSDVKISDVIGPTADILFSLREVDARPIVAFELKAERLEIPRFTMAIDKRISLQGPAQIVLKLPSSVINQQLKALKPRVQSPVVAELKINSFSFPVASLKNPSFLATGAIYKLDLDATLNLSPIKLIELPTIGTATINDISLGIDAGISSRPEIKLTANLQPDGAGPLYDLIGKNAGLIASGAIGMGIDGNPVLNVFNVQVLSELGRLEMSGKTMEGNRLVLNSPALVSYTLTAAGLQTMGIATDNYLFAHGAPLELNITSSHIPLRSRDFGLLKLAGTMKINDLQVKSRTQTGMPQAVLDNLTAEWSIDAAANRIALDFTGITLLGQQEAAGKLKGTVFVDQWFNDGALDLSSAQVRVNTSTTNLPTQFLSSVTGQTDLVPIIGNALNMDLVANFSLAAASTGNVALDLSSENLNGSLDLTLGDVIKLNTNRPAEFRLKLTPQGYDTLRQRFNGNLQTDFSLDETALAIINLKSLTFPKDKPFVQSGIDADYSIEKLVGIDHKSGNKIALNHIKGRINSLNIANHIDFDMAAKGQASQGVPTAWNIVGALDKGFGQDGSLNRQDLSLQLDANVESLPIPLLCQFISSDPKLRQKLEALIGPTLNAKIKAQLQRMNGPLFVDINGKNGNLIIDASLNNGYLLLNKPLTAQLTVTPQLSKHVLADLIPVISGMLGADHPIKLTIDPQGFAIPLNDPSPKTASIGRASLEFGKVRFSGSSQLAKVLSLLTPANNDQFMVWLTPAYFSLNQGVLSLSRVDMLISDNYPIAAWGNVDLGRERVHMMIGLSGAAIEKAFGVSGIARSNFLQIPLRGKLDNPSIDKAKAAARISALVAQSQGGPQGMVIGTVLDIASGGLTEGPPPAPTTNPLPWAELMKDAPGSEKGTIEKQIMTPIEEIGKGASSILKKIFK